MAICPFATQHPGPADKQGRDPPRGFLAKGAVLHSAEGYHSGLYSRLFGPDPVSWHFSIMQDGTVEQHYDTWAECWHAGSPNFKPPMTWSGEANVRFWGIEHEGMASEPLTDDQLDASVRLLKWLWETHNLREYSLLYTLWEHNWLAPTSCPSNRIPWGQIIARLEGDLTMTQYQQLIELIQMTRLDLEVRLDIAGSALRGDYEEALRLMVQWKRWPDTVSIPPELTSAGTIS